MIGEQGPATIAVACLAAVGAAYGAVDGPVGEALPYAGAAGILLVVVKGLQFLAAYQDRIVIATNKRLDDANKEIAALKVELAEARRQIGDLYNENWDLRQQTGYPERRHTRPKPPPEDEGPVGP